MKKIIGLLLLLCPLMVLADGPQVIDAVPVSDDQSLEQKVEFLTQLNIPQKTQELQQSIQDLQGLVESQAHEISELKTQMKTIYSDLDSRMNQLTASNASTEKPAVNVSTQKVEAEGSTAEKSLYDSAFQLVKYKHYQAALTSFNQYLSHYPDGKYAVNAHYWMGELYALAGDDSLAQSEFEMIVNGYPNSTKAADALLQLASMAYTAGRFSEAKNDWQKIISNKAFEKTSAADVAKKRLEQLQHSGN